MSEVIDGLTKRLDTLENKVKILVRQALLSPDSTTKSLDIALSDPVHAIITVVAYVHGIEDIKDITVNKNGSVSVRSARRMSMYLCKEYDAGRLKDVSRKFGINDHGSIIRASYVAKDMLERSALFKARCERAREILNGFFCPQQSAKK